MLYITTGIFVVGSQRVKKQSKDLRSVKKLLFATQFGSD